MLIGIDCRKAADFGIGTYICGLVEALTHVQGDEAYVLFGPSRVKALLPSDSRFRFRQVDSPNYSLKELFALGREIRDSGLDLFHAPHYVVPFTSRPVVVTIHDLIHLTTPRSSALETIYARWMIGRAVSKSERILTVSQTVREQLGRHYPKAVGKLVAIPNGVDHAFSPEPDHRDANVIDRYGLKPRRYLLYVGNDKPHKNLDRLVSAHQSLIAEGKDLRLVLAGAAPSRFAGIPSILLAGYVPQNDLPALYRNAMAVALISTEEGFGLPVAEAMACGTPAIVSNIPALHELVGDDALLVDPRSEAAIAHAVQRCLSDDRLLQSMRIRLVNQGPRRTWSATAEATLDVYRQVMSGTD